MLLAILHPGQAIHPSKHSIRATHQHHLELQDIHLPHILATSSQAIPAILRTQPSLIAQPPHQDFLSPIQLLSKGTHHTNSLTSRPRSAPSQLVILKLFQVRLPITFPNTFHQWSSSRPLFMRRRLSMLGLTQMLCTRP